MNTAHPAQALSAREREIAMFVAEGMSNNVPVPGRIDYAGDQDVFRFTTRGGSSVTVLRVANLALGIKPHVRVLGPNGTTVLSEVSQPPSGSTYIYIPLTKVPPNTTLYAQISDDSGSAGGGLYEISAGS